MLGIIGLFAGDKAIRDPGQIREGGLVAMYLIGAVVMLVNGWITHKLAEKAYSELPPHERQEEPIQKSEPKEDQAATSSDSTSV